MKKCISVLLVLLLICSFCLPVLAAEQTQWGYDLHDDVRSCIAGWQVGKDAEPIERTLDVKENYGYMPLVKESLLRQLTCRIEGKTCDALSLCSWEDLRVLCTENGELADFSFRLTDDGMVEMQVKLTSAARKLSTPQTLSGTIYLQSKDSELIHLSEGIPFTFTLTRQTTQTPDVLVIALIAVVAALFIAVAVTAVLLFKKKK